MQSTVELYNLALAWLGGEQLPTVQNEYETTTIGQLCINNFPHVLDVALSTHNWSFAIRRVALAAKPCSGEPEYAYRYGLPSNCLKPLRLIGGGSFGDELGPQYVIEGIDILCNVSEAWLVYVAREEDPRQWPPHFSLCLSWALAGVLSVARNNDVKRQQLCEQNYRITLYEAIAQDEARQNPESSISQWRKSRWATGGSYE